MLPDLKHLQNVQNHSLFKLCKFHEKNYVNFFARGQNVPQCLSIKDIIAPSIMPISIDLNVKCPYYKRWNLKGEKNLPFFFSCKIFSKYRFSHAVSSKHLFIMLYVGKFKFVPKIWIVQLFIPISSMSVLFQSVVIWFHCLVSLFHRRNVKFVSSVGSCCMHKWNSSLFNDFNIIAKGIRQLLRLR